MTELTQALSEIDLWIRVGEVRRARLRLKEIAAKKPARELAADLSALAWRAGLPLLGIRVLNPIVRPGPKRPVTATPKELSQYGACLVRIGATEEAAGILDRLAPDKDPLVWLFRAFARVARWEYGESIGSLRPYLQSPALSDYQRLVGEANLAAALVYERQFKEAEPLLDRLIDVTRREGHRLLLGSALDLAAELQISQQRWDEADDALKRAEDALGDSESLNAFFLRKWRAAVGFGRNPRSTRAQAALDGIRGEAVDMGHWETVRLCDRLKAVWGRDEKLFTHVYFGTPFASFRRWMEVDWGSACELPRDHLWRLPDASAKGLVFDGSRGLWRDQAALKPGSLLHRLVLVLSSDFYRPFRLAVVHHRLYPDEFFHPVHSPPRIYDAVQRFRKWTAEMAVPLKIEEKEGAYRLGADRAVSVRVALESRTASRLDLKVESLRENVGMAAFSIKQACRHLSAPERTARRLLATAREAGLVETLGKGPATRYRFLKKAG